MDRQQWNSSEISNLLCLKNVHTYRQSECIHMQRSIHTDKVHARVGPADCQRDLQRLWLKLTSESFQCLPGSRVWQQRLTGAGSKHSSRGSSLHWSDWRFASQMQAIPTPFRENLQSTCMIVYSITVGRWMACFGTCSIAIV